MQIPIISGIGADENSEFRTSYPVNMVPVPKRTGISAGYLRPAEGIESLADGQGEDRGAIKWNDVCYRVSGTKLISVSAEGTVTVLGDVGGSGEVSLDYSFDRLFISSSGSVYYWDGTALTQVTDPDLGYVYTGLWIDGYFAYNDSGSNIVVTDLADPTSIDPLKYGSSEVDPDPVMRVLKPRNELHAVNRYTIEGFYNNPNAGTGFPFAVIRGSHISKGSVGRYASCEFLDAIAFVGGGRKESNSVYLGIDGAYRKIATREIDDVLNAYTEAELSTAVCEAVEHKSHSNLYIRLPDRTLVYDSEASKAVGQPVWYCLSGAVSGFVKHPCANRVWCYGKWIVGDSESSAIGTLTESKGSLWGSHVGWQFDTAILYAEGRDAIIHELELVALTGRVALGDTPMIGTMASYDGETFSEPKFISAGTIGDRLKKLIWTSQGNIGNWRSQRFFGTTQSHASFARLQARVEALAH